MKSTKKKTKTRKKSTKFKVDTKASQGKEDVSQRKKYNKGGRIEAYTFGDALSKKEKKSVWGWK